MANTGGTAKVSKYSKGVKTAQNTRAAAQQRRNTQTTKQNGGSSDFKFANDGGTKPKGDDINASVANIMRNINKK